MIFVRKASYHFKAQECKAFDFVKLFKKNMFNGTFEIRFLLILVRDV